MVSLLDNGSCFRKVAPNTRSSEKVRIALLDLVSGCMADAALSRHKRPLLYSSPPEWRPRGCRPSLPSAFPPTGNGPPSAREPHVPSLWRPRYLRMCRSGTSVRPVYRSCGTGAWHMPMLARHARMACMYGPIPTCSGWIAAAAQKLWSPGSSSPRPSPMLGAASRGTRGLLRLLSLL